MRAAYAISLVAGATAFAAVYPTVAALFMAVLGSGIATTFAWLWWRRATPLAAGLAGGWLGAVLLCLSTDGGTGRPVAGIALCLAAASGHLRIIARVGALRIAAAGMAAGGVGWALLV